MRFVCIYNVTSRCIPVIITYIGPEQKKNQSRLAAPHLINVGFLNMSVMVKMYILDLFFFFFFG